MKRRVADKRRLASLPSIRSAGWLDKAKTIEQVSASRFSEIINVRTWFDWLICLTLHSESDFIA